MDHLALSKSTIQRSTADHWTAEQSESLRGEATAHALIAIAERLDKVVNELQRPGLQKLISSVSVAAESKKPCGYCHEEPCNYKAGVHPDWMLWE